jgi:MraZ protein
MFMGEYDHTLDPKGRMIVPSKFREELGERFILTMGLDGCLFAYPQTEWERFVEGLRKLPGTKEARQLQRHFMARAAEADVDKQGRFLIPAKLRELAGLTKDVVLVGAISKVEIWSKELWEQMDSDDNADEVAEHMAEYGLSF